MHPGAYRPHIAIFHIFAFPSYRCCCFRVLSLVRLCLCAYVPLTLYMVCVLMRYVCMCGVCVLLLMGMCVRYASMCVCPLCVYVLCVCALCV